MNNSRYDFICFSAPSGTGKSTIISHLMDTEPQLALSISATTRAPRGTEINGVEYIFLRKEDFETKIKNAELLEFEEVHGNYYGTLIETVENFLGRNKTVVFDIDVNGALKIKEKYGDRALLIFLKPPSIEELKRRLKNRKTETAERIEKRLKRLPYELEKGQIFDVIVVNDHLQETVNKIKDIIHGGQHGS